MVIQERSQQGCCILEGSGRMDFKARHAFQVAMKTAQTSGAAHIVFDLKEVSFIDSAGLALLVLANRGCEERNVRFSLCQPQNPVKDVLELTNMGKHFPISESLETALLFTHQPLIR
ncbi:MAG: STAS domain-containing protein [Nitrospirota bacterium]|nr:STAS domain-containing protein [Nitrospirota bacterium]